MTNVSTEYSNISIPDISEYSKYIFIINLSDNNDCIIVFKTLMRSRDVIVDVYINEISEDTLVQGGIVLKEDSVVCNPNFDLGFNYTISCSNLDDFGSSLDKYNAYNFYLEFHKGDGLDWYWNEGLYQ